MIHEQVSPPCRGRGVVMGKAVWSGHSVAVVLNRVEELHVLPRPEFNDLNEQCNELEHVDAPCVEASVSHLNVAQYSGTTYKEPKRYPGERRAHCTGLAKDAIEMGRHQGCGCTSRPRTARCGSRHQR